MKFPEFKPNLDTLDLDPPNIFTPKQKRKKIDISIDLSIPPSFLSSCSQHLHILMNKTINLFDVLEVKLCVYFLL